MFLADCLSHLKRHLFALFVFLKSVILWRSIFSLGGRIATRTHFFNYRITLQLLTAFSHFLNIFNLSERHFTFNIN
jgi:hypothetical protein